MYELIVFLPLLGFLIAGIFGPWIGARGAEYVTTSLLGVSFVLSWIAFVMVAGGADAHVLLGNWFTSGKVVASWALRIDTLTAVMLVVVTTVSFLVHVYSIGYMSDDPSRPRFFAYLSLFTFAMLMLVTSDNLVQLFFGWEGVGLMSYLLVGFWYERPDGQRRGDQGLRRQSGWRLRFLARHLPHLLSHRFNRLRSGVRRRARSCRKDGAFHRLRLGRGDARLPAPVHGRDGQVGAVPASHLASRRDGGPDPGLGPHSCGDHGHRGRIHGREAVAAVRAVFGRAQRRDNRGRDNGVLRGDYRPGAERHQESDRVFDVLAARLHVRGSRRRRLQRRHFPPLYPCLLQGAVVPRRGLGHYRHAPRAGHAGDGGAAQGDPVHLLDDDDRNACPDRRRDSVHADRVRRLRLQGCDHRGCVRLASLRGGLWILMHRRRRRPDRLLFLAPRIHDLLRPARRLGRRPCRRTCARRSWRTAIMATALTPAHEFADGDARAARGAGARGDIRRHGLPLPVHWRRLRGVLAQLAVPRTGEPPPRGNGARAGV